MESNFFFQDQSNTHRYKWLKFLTKEKNESIKLKEISSPNWRFSQNINMTRYLWTDFFKSTTGKYSVAEFTIDLLQKFYLWQPVAEIYLWQPVAEIYQLLVLKEVITWRICIPMKFWSSQILSELKITRLQTVTKNNFW